MGAIKPDPQVLVQRLPDGEAVLLHMGTEIYYGLNPTGARMWDALVETGDRDRAVEALLEEFDVDEARLRDDLEGVIGQLAGAGLLETDDEQPA